jgi:hypothetical protein
MLLITQPLFRNGTLNLDNGMYVGFTTMVIAFSMVFFGIKTHRDQNLGGAISFGGALKVGALIAFVASLTYAISWEVYYNTAGSDFLEWYQTCQLEKLTKEGATEAEITDAKAEMATMSELYQNPIIRFGMTLTEIFPVGVLVALISAALLRRKEFLPANP